MDSGWVFEMTNMMGQPLHQALLKILTAQRDLYLQLSDLARRQSQHVARGESEELMTVLAARNRLIEQLAPLDQQLTPYKGRWQEILNMVSPRDRESLASRLQEVQKLLADILAQDEADKDLLIKQKTEVNTQINQVVSGTQLNRAYGVKPRAIAGSDLGGFKG